jgi:hypothetical protein
MGRCRKWHSIAMRLSLRLGGVVTIVLGLKVTKESTPNNETSPVDQPVPAVDNPPREMSMILWAG